MIKTVLSHLFGKKEISIPSVVITCECGNDLTVGSFVSDTYDESDENHVKYKCTECGLESDFNFDIAPVPINWKDIESQRKTREAKLELL